MVSQTAEKVDVPFSEYQQDDNRNFTTGSLKCYVSGGGGIRFPRKKHYKGVRLNIIIVQEKILIGGQIRKIVQHILQKRFDLSRW